MRAERFGWRVARAPGFVVVQANVDQARQKGTCREHHGAALESDAKLGHGTGDALLAADSLDQQVIAGLPRVKLRLGRLVARKGGVEQKGVDSLIVHDLITLVHERAAATMFLLAGDEDLREGVAAAQHLGVQTGWGVARAPPRDTS